jgi:hypothetical protein
VHAIRLIMHRNPSLIALSLDLKNAFNTIRRDDVAQQLHASFPELMPFFKMTCNPKSRLYVRHRRGGVRDNQQRGGHEAGGPDCGYALQHRVPPRSHRHPGSVPDRITLRHPRRHHLSGPAGGRVPDARLGSAVSASDNGVPSSANQDFGVLPGGYAPAGVLAPRHTVAATAPARRPPSRPRTGHHVCPQHIRLGHGVRLHRDAKLRVLLVSSFVYSSSFDALSPPSTTPPPSWTPPLPP